MLSVLVNCAAIIVGSILGLLLKKVFSKKMGDAIMNGMALCVMYIGISGALKGSNPIITIIAVAVGTLVGTFLHLNDGLEKLGKWVEGKFKKKKVDENGLEIETQKQGVAEAFVSSTLLFCVGAMAVVGSLNAGLTGDNSTIYAKSIIDGVSSIFFASTIGFGVALSSISVFIYQGAIVLLASLLKTVLTDYIIAEMTCVGSLLIIALSLNMLKLTKIKIMDMVPSIFFPILLCQFIK